MRVSDIAVGRTKQPFFFFGIALIIYLAMSIVSSFGVRAIERWSERGETSTT
jgi:polar amino acid transport system permease protein